MPPTSPDQSIPRRRQRLGGAFICACGLFLAYLATRQALRDGEFSFRGSFLGPAFAVLGLGLMIWPGYREERLARGEDISSLQGMRLLTARWWAILIAGLLAGALYSLALSRGWLT